MTAQASAQEAINAGCIAHAPAFTRASATQSVPEVDEALKKLCTDANQSWKDTNDLLFNHLLKYDHLLGEYLTESGRALQAKQEQIWACTQAVANTIGMSPETHLGLALNMLEHLPTTPPGLSFMSGIPLMMTYSPEALTYQAEGIEACTFQLNEDSTAAVVLSNS